MGTPTLQINEDDPRFFGLLPEGQEFEVAVRPPGDAEWALVRIPANTALVCDSGLVEFYLVDEDVWHLVQGIPSAWLGPYRPVPFPSVEVTEAVAHQETVADEEDPYLKLIRSEGVAPEFVAELKSSTDRASLTNQRAQILGDLSRGKFPAEEFETVTGPVRAPQRLKDVWDGKGESLDDKEDLADGWPQNATQENLDAWRKNEQARINADMERLRRESDAEAEEIFKSYPVERRDHLREVSGS